MNCDRPFQGFAIITYYLMDMVKSELKGRVMMKMEITGQDQWRPATPAASKAEAGRNP
jgi:hypothetical protein